MFNSAIIDVAIGLTLSFLAVSLAASAITEAISSVMKLREETLLKGVKALLNDPNFTGIVRDLYNHALVNPLADGKAETIEKLSHKPAYIDSEQFAVAIYSSLSNGGALSTDAAIASIPDPQLKSAMEALWTTARQDVGAFKKNIAIWFDNSMDRLSGWYKRTTQLVSFFVAFFIAAAFNVNALYESAQIWTRPSVIADLATPHFLDDVNALNHRNDQAAADASKKDQGAPEASKIYNPLETAFLIGWVKGPMPYNRDSWFIAIVSWIMVAAATLFGASFWFDILQRLTHLKGTGLKPERSAK